MVPRSTIYKQKRKFFCSCFYIIISSPALSDISQNNTEMLESSAMKCSNSIRKSNSPSFICKRQQRPIMQSIQLRKPGERQRPKPRKRLKNRELQRRRRSWSTSNDSRTKCQRKKPPFWKRLRDPRSQDLSVRKLPPEMRRGNSFSRRLKESNQGSTAEIPQ